MTGVQTCALPICFPVTIGGAGFPMISSFLGNFNGDNKKLIGLYINKPTTDKVALFNKEAVSGYTGATVRNLIVEDSIIIGQNIVGTITAYTYQFNIDNCHVINGIVTGVGNVGGISGQWIRGYDIKDSSYNGVVKATGNNCGGIAGSIDNASYEATRINNCEVEVTINSTGGNIGGICGWCEGDILGIELEEGDVVINARPYRDWETEVVS